MSALTIAFQSDDPQWRKLLRAHRKLFVAALNASHDALDLPLKKFSVSVVLTDDARMQNLNAQYRGKDKPTNVLSFPQIDDFSTADTLAEPIELGDIVLAYETILQEAETQQKKLQHHVAHLLVHGLLHLFGHDHMTRRDEKAMEALEIAILAGLGIADPYA